jgi:hypothetical protein
MPESKHFSGFAKLFTDFQKVTFESEKDLPVFLLNKSYILSPYQTVGKQQDKKRLVAIELKKIADECASQF